MTVDATVVASVVVGAFAAFGVVVLVYVALRCAYLSADALVGAISRYWSRRMMSDYDRRHGGDER